MTEGIRASLLRDEGDEPLGVAGAIHPTCTQGL
jgi:hypothetical protein